MGCVDSKPLDALEGWWKVPFSPISNKPSSKVGLKSRELAAYDWAQEGLGDSDASPSVLGTPAQFVRKNSLYLGGIHGEEHEEQAPPIPRRALSVGPSGQFRTIQDALDDANDGDVIRISEGRYRETLVVRKRVQLIGVGRVAETVIQGPDVTLWGGSQFATLVLEASEARVCNLTLHNASPSAAVVENFCGDVTLEGCWIRGGGTGVKVCNSAAAVVRFCDLQDARHHGVHVSAQACASVIKSHVFRCTSGVVVGDVGSQCSVTGTDLELCTQVGLVLHSSAQALIDDNNISRNTAAGICLSAGARAVITSNRICGNGRVGVCIVDESAASLTNNDLRHNGAHEGECFSLFVGNNCQDLVSAEDNMVDSVTGTNPEGTLSPFFYPAPGVAHHPARPIRRPPPGGILSAALASARGR